MTMFALAPLAAVAAMAFIGASSAMATEDTQLCWEHKKLCKENLVTVFDMLAETTLLKTNLATILCLHSKAELEVEEPQFAKAPEPLGVKVTALTWETCGTNSKHDNCTVTNLKYPLLDILETELNLGTATALGAEVLVECTKTIVGTIHCIYGGPEVKGFTVEGALHKEGTGHGMFTATELLIPKVEGGFACPKESKWTALYEPLAHLYIVGTEGTELCWEHESPCANNQVGSFEMVAETTELLTNLANILCLHSVAELEVESPNLATAPEPLGVSVILLTWENCGTNSTHNNCEVNNLKLPLLDILKTELNLGSATALGAEVLVKCTKVPLVGTIHCIYGGPEVKGFTVEGALHKEGTGFGMFTASKLLVPKVEGGFACPKESKWDALFEPLKHLYIVS